jgi:hypothetical protein
MEFRAPYGWHEVDGATLLYIREKLKLFESMTLNEILGPNHHKVRIDQLCSTAQSRLAELRLDDVEELISLRLTGRQRVWGVLEHNVVILLWWDPEHQVCPSLLRNT